MGSRAQYIDTLHDCVLIPNQTYCLSGDPVQRVQPQVCPTITLNPRPPNPPSCTQLMANFRLNLRMQHFSILRTIATTPTRLKSTWPGVRDMWFCAWRALHGDRDGCQSGCFLLSPLWCGYRLSRSRVSVLYIKRFTNYFNGQPK